jgi:hypothetical protein
MLVVDACRIECESIIFAIQVTASRIIGKYHQSDKVLHGTDWISCSTLVAGGVTCLRRVTRYDSVLVK